MDEQTRVKVWQKATLTYDLRPGNWALDSYGNKIRWEDYGNRESLYGWEIHHIVPQSRGGDDRLSNLQPLQWEENVRQGNRMPF